MTDPSIRIFLDTLTTTLALLRYWQQNAWRNILNNLPIPEQDLPNRQLLSEAILKTGMLSAGFSLDIHQTLTPVWIAPVVYHHRLNKNYWIPIWIPAQLQNGIFHISKETLPWIPPSQFDPLKGYSPFSAPFHEVDEWVRNELFNPENNTCYERWPDYYQACMALLDHLSEGEWHERLIAQGYHPLSLVEQAYLVLGSDLDNLKPTFTQPLTQQLSHQQINPLLNHYAQIGEEADFIENFNNAKKENLDGILQAGEFLSVQLLPNQSKRQLFEKFIQPGFKTILLTPDKSFSSGDPIFKDWYLLTADLGNSDQDNSDQHNFWQAIESLPNSVDLLLIDQANLLSPQQVIPFLSIAKRAVFVGDDQAFSPTLSLSHYQDDNELQKHQLVDDEIIEQMQYKGMLLGTGNALTVSIRNSSYQYLNLNQQPRQRSPAMHYYSVVGESQRIANQNFNLKEAQALVDWLQANKALNEFKDVVIFTPFEAQKETILPLLSAANITTEVHCFWHLPHQQWSTVVFSSVYVLGDQRPFIFDQGEAIFYTLKSCAKEVIWIIGDNRIFDPKTHSPSGKIAKMIA